MPYNQDLGSAVRRYVNSDRRYLRLLHGRLLRLAEPERTGFFRALGRDAAAADAVELSYMLGTSSGWRERLTAAWMAGISSRTGLREQIGGLLIESAQVYAGQGYCFALACFGTADDADLLRAYLDRYLQRPDLVYDQRWAMSALLHIDKRLGNGFAGPYLAPDGLWPQWSRAEDARTRLERGSEHLAALLSLRSEIATARTSDAETTIDKGRLPSGWIALGADQATGLEAELSRELGEQHMLRGIPTTAVARCEGCGTVLFRLNEDPVGWAIIHLTWPSRAEREPFPMWETCASTETALARIRKHGH